MSNFIGGCSVCPFYLREWNKSITCEGFVEDTEQMMRFRGMAEKEAHQRRYCMTMDYQKCPLAILVTSKY